MSLTLPGLGIAGLLQQVLNQARSSQEAAGLLQEVLNRAHMFLMLPSRETADLVPKGKLEAPVWLTPTGPQTAGLPQIVLLQASVLLMLPGWETADLLQTVLGQAPLWMLLG